MPCLFISDLASFRKFWKNSKSFGLFLGEGETLTATFTVEVNDGNNGTKQQNIVITIKGTNEQPVINVIDDEGRVSDGSTLSDSGSINFSDIDISNKPVVSESLTNIQAVDKDGNYKTITSFKDSSQAVKRQAAQFKVYYTNSNGKEVPLVVKDEKNKISGTIVSGPTGSGELIDIVF